MRYLPLVWSAILRKPMRAVMTLLAVTVAFTVFGLVIGLSATIDGVEQRARDDRIFSSARFGYVDGLPIAVAARSREIATLRALGYGGLPVAVSVILEAATLSVAGALIGAAFAWARYDRVIDGFGSDIFKMTVSPAMIGIALLWAIAVAFLGGILPSIQAATRPVTDALRAT